MSELIKMLILEPSDTQQNYVAKSNYNFQRLIDIVNGVITIKGDKGNPGLPGIPGAQGLSGDQGYSLYTYYGDPNDDAEFRQWVIDNNIKIGDYVLSTADNTIHYITNLYTFPTEDPVVDFPTIIQSAVDTSPTLEHVFSYAYTNTDESKTIIPSYIRSYDNTQNVSLLLTNFKTSTEYDGNKDYCKNSNYHFITLYNSVDNHIDDMFTTQTHNYYNVSSIVNTQNGILLGSRIESGESSSYSTFQDSLKILYNYDNYNRATEGVFSLSNDYEIILQSGSTFNTGFKFINNTGDYTQYNELDDYIPNQNPIISNSDFKNSFVLFGNKGYLKEYISNINHNIINSITLTSNVDSSTYNNNYLSFGELVNREFFFKTTSTLHLDINGILNIGVDSFLNINVGDNISITNDSISDISLIPNGNISIGLNSIDLNGKWNGIYLKNDIQLYDKNNAKSYSSIYHLSDCLYITNNPTSTHTAKTSVYYSTIISSPDTTLYEITGSIKIKTGDSTYSLQGQTIGNIELITGNPTGYYGSGGNIILKNYGNGSIILDTNSVIFENDSYNSKVLVTSSNGTISRLFSTESTIPSNLQLPYDELITVNTSSSYKFVMSDNLNFLQTKINNIINHINSDLDLNILSQTLGGTVDYTLHSTDQIDTQHCSIKIDYFINQNNKGIVNIYGYVKLINTNLSANHFYTIGYISNSSLFPTTTKTGQGIFSETNSASDMLESIIWTDGSGSTYGYGETLPNTPTVFSEFQSALIVISSSGRILISPGASVSHYVRFNFTYMVE